MTRKINDILLDLYERRCSGSSKFYKKLEDPEERKLIHDLYKEKLDLPIDGARILLYNKQNTKISIGYKRIVIGDYGAYLEIDPEDIVHENIKNKWPGKPRRPVKYIWMETIDLARTKIYFQQGKVEYADYIPGMYYVDSKDVCYARK